MSNILLMIPSLYGGGAEKVCCILACQLAKRHNVTVAYLIEKDQTYHLSEGINKVVLPKPTFSRWNPLKKIIRPIRKYRFFRNLKKNNDIDVAVSFLSGMNTINILSRSGERVVLSERANPRKYQPWKFPWTAFLYRCADHVVFQSEQVQNLYGKKIRAHSSIIYNPVLVDTKASSKTRHKIVSVGRLEEQKNHEMLIHSFWEFQREYADYTLSIYGEGSLFEKLKGLIEELGLADKIFLCGNIKDVHEKIKDAQFFVLSSNYEGLSNSLLECMAMGIPCISTACEGSAEIIRDGENGLLIPIGDQKALTQAMKKMAENEDLREKCRRQAMADTKDLTPETIAKAWEKILIK